ncbi:MAG: hypothetical protein MUP66_01540 [Candidatus Nanohaloarchaeota archaeon QJJ-5]|nr:hypothetical protein [Candidatus Nanohaloarchaeota archaeon QJJ-5]
MPEQPDQQQVMQAFQQKIGNLELTLNALLGVLDEKEVIEQDEINEKAQEIIQDIQEQQGEGAGAPDMAPDHDHEH